MHILGVPAFLTLLLACTPKICIFQCKPLYIDLSKIQFSINFVSLTYAFFGFNCIFFQTFSEIGYVREIGFLDYKILKKSIYIGLG